MSISTVTVLGMTCGHCAHSVREEVDAIPGVTDVDVDLNSGRVTIGGSASVDRNAIKRAIEAAGYELKESPQ
jgi:copper chaperone